MPLQSSGAISIRDINQILGDYTDPTESLNSLKYLRSSLIPRYLAQVQASDGEASSLFGGSLAISGDGNTLAVGDSYYTAAGPVYVYTRSGAAWVEQARLEATDGSTSSFNVPALALSSDGNTLVAGSQYDVVSGLLSAGSVYVYTRSGGVWTLQARLTASDAEAYSYFGGSVALSSDGNTLAVGSTFDNNTGGTDSGSVYIFTRSGATWTQQARLQAADAAAADRFGESVALSSDGNTLAVGTPYDNNTGGTDAGSVYIFTRSGATWTQQARRQAEGAAASDLFGYSVALSSDGNLLAVGAAYVNTAGGPDAGAVYIFTRSGTTWFSQGRVTASDAAANDFFGDRVSLSGDGNLLAVGARQDDNSGGANAGSVYLFARKDGVWTEQTRLQALDAETNEYFGSAVALSTDGLVMAVGIPYDDNPGGENAGSADVYSLDTGTVSLSDFYGQGNLATTEYARLQTTDAAAGDRFAVEVALNSDGSTLAASAYLDNNSGGINAGSVYIFTRIGTTWTQQARLQASDAAADDYFGSGSALSDDGNTLAVGAVNDDNSGGTNAGSIYIFTRSGSTWTQQARLQASDAAADDAAGWSVALNSDGNTLAVGSRYDDNSGGTNAGSVYIFTRSGATWTQQARLQASNAAVGDWFGSSVALSADGNTLAVGSVNANNSSGVNAGSAYIFTRSNDVWSEQARLEASDTTLDDGFGESVTLSSDGNTIAVGSPYDDNSGGTNAGSVYIFTRSGATWTQQARLQAFDAAQDDWFGHSVNLSSDGNTLVAGSIYKELVEGINAGVVYMFTRSGTTWTTQARLQASNAAAGDSFGQSVALSNDGNILAVGADFDNNSGGNDAGSVYVFQPSRIGFTNWISAGNPYLRARKAVFQGSSEIIVNFNTDGTVSYEASGASPLLGPRRWCIGNPFAGNYSVRFYGYATLSGDASLSAGYANTTIYSSGYIDTGFVNLNSDVQFSITLYAQELASGSAFVDFSGTVYIKHNSTGQIVSLPAVLEVESLTD